jgi:hypothetical protein
MLLLLLRPPPPKPARTIRLPLCRGLGLLVDGLPGLGVLLDDGLAHLALHPDVVDNVPLGVSQGRDEELVPEGGAVGLFS